jgi:hypothetical protein
LSLCNHKLGQADLVGWPLTAVFVCSELITIAEQLTTIVSATSCAWKKRLLENPHHPPPTRILTSFRTGNSKHPEKYNVGDW